MSDEKLVHRLNRIIGQIQSIKKKLEDSSDDDCVKTLQQLKASVNGLKKFGEAYMISHMNECMAQNKKPEEIKDNLAKVISGAFFL